MKNKIVFLFAIVIFGTTVAMNKSYHIHLLHQPLHGHIDLRLRSWLLSRSGTSIIDCHESPVCHVAVIPDGRTVITASEDHKVRIWDVQSGICRHTLAGHTGPIRSIKIIPEQNRVLTLSDDHTARIWNLVNGACEHVLAGHTKPIWHARLTPDSKSIITKSADKSARVWDTASGACTCTIDCTPEILRGAKLTPDGNIAITQSSPDISCIYQTNTYNVRIWDVRTGAGRYRLSFPGTYLFYSIKVSPEGKTMATIRVGDGSEKYQYCQLWDIATGAMLAVLSRDLYSKNVGGGEHSGREYGDVVNYIAFESENSVILYYNHRACIIDLLTGNRREIRLDGGIDQDYSCYYPDLTHHSTDTHTAITVYENDVSVWNLPEGTLRQVIPNPFFVLPRNSSDCSHACNDGFFSRIWQYGASWFNKSYNNLVMNAHGNRMASVTTDGCNVQVWNIEKKAYAEALAQLSVLQIALLSEIQHRLQTGGNRLILRPGSANYCAYQSLTPVIKNAIRSCISIYRPQQKAGCDFKKNLTLM